MSILLCFLFDFINEQLENDLQRRIMQKKTLEAHEFPLKEVFCDDYSFEIPGYQRPYSWEVEQAETLVSDLIGFLSEQPPNIQDANPYFLGSIVLIKDTGTLAQVVDGQQRLTTLTILLSVLRSLLPETKRAVLEGAILQKGDEILLTEDKPRLQTRPKDQQFFLRHIQEFGGLETLFENNDKLNDSQSNILNNAKAMHAQLVKLDEAQLIRLTQFIMNGCFVVLVTTPDIDSAYRIFSVMNDRGMDLSATDILKSLVTGAISETNSKQEFYTNKWEDLEEEIGRERFGALFAHIRMIEMRAKSRSNMVSDFKNHIKPELYPIDFIDNKLTPYTRIYSEILDQSFCSQEHAYDINRSLFWLTRIDNNDWVPPALYFINKFRNHPAKVAYFLDRLEKLASVQMINRISINHRIIRYTSILNAIDAGTVFEENKSGAPLYLSEEEKQDALKQLNGPIYKLSRIRVMVLLRLDSELGDSMATYKHSKVTVEHVMPQTINPISQWQEWCPDKETHEELVHCLGNLALLSRNKNSAASNYDFAKKKSEYFNPANGHTAFILTNQILAQEKWTPDDIRERQKFLLSKLASTWQLDSQ